MVYLPALHTLFNGNRVNLSGNFSHFFKKVKNASFLGYIRYLRLKVTGKTVIVTGRCNGCGTCCRSISLEHEGGWIRNEKTFDRIVKNYPEYDRFKVIGNDNQGFLLFNCSWITSEGICRDYENRLRLCEDFPETSLVFCGGQLPRNCGYCFAEVVPFDKILKKELKKK